MQIGDFVHAAQVNGEHSVQGIYAGDLGEDVIDVHGQLGTYTCYKHDANVVPDKNLWGDTRKFVHRWRNEHRGS